MSGGRQEPRPVNDYREPTGRCGSTNGPGLGGENHGNSGIQSPPSPPRAIPPGQKGPYR